MKAFAARLSDTEYEGLVKLGEVQERSINALLREAVRQYLERQQESRPPLC
ncbi:MAG: ribbon-helix-helix protein, CopG family [Jaaginema sp. PMC 1080.18]|nr:ribbon-helix-helix protein, CopG family [Jaaginema sp. PMC 1080.18]MEC4807226.1 ribbon-helix-helix protein, CopG family [Jaaginema sp. PMC 1080.18]